MLYKPIADYPFDMSEFAEISKVFRNHQSVLESVCFFLCQHQLHL